ncbi:hypothetical protein BDZ97DRAFT_1851710 [Flammula alnicola]|nr:hypothetical protein BDZ97DRAFT_1851710 [Flammula alnicola]
MHRKSDDYLLVPIGSGAIGPPNRYSANNTSTNTDFSRNGPGNILQAFHIRRRGYSHTLLRIWAEIVNSIRTMAYTDSPSRLRSLLLEVIPNPGT